MRYSEINHTQNLREKIYYIFPKYTIGVHFGIYTLTNSESRKGETI